MKCRNFFNSLIMFLAVFAIFFLFLSISNNESQGAAKNKKNADVVPNNIKPAPGTEGIMQTFAEMDGSVVTYLENTDGTDDGPSKLLLGLLDVSFYSLDGNTGLIGWNDVVMIKINSQWAERGGTNTDLLKSLIEFILNHPKGFNGEIVVADNGQGMFGSEGKGGKLNWASPNSKDKKQSAVAVISYFASRGHKVSGISFDGVTKTKVGEFSGGDKKDGYVVEPGIKPTGIVISYPKWTTPYGTMISFKNGIWNGKEFNSEKLKVINMPVLKTHYLYHVTGAVKSYMGIPSNALTDLTPHKSVGQGGMGTLMAGTRFPTLNILDMIYITPRRGPASSYDSAVQKNMIAASTDPFALDRWAVIRVLTPAARAAGESRLEALSTGGTDPGSFGYWLRKSMAEVKNAGIPVTLDNSSIFVYRINN